MQTLIFYRPDRRACIHFPDFHAVNGGKILKVAEFPGVKWAGHIVFVNQGQSYFQSAEMKCITQPFYVCC